MKKLLISAIAISFLAACKKDDSSSNNATPAPSNASPVVTLSQVNYARLSETVGNAVYMTATATDADGSVAKVVFYANNVPYDTVTVAGSNARTSASQASVVSNIYYAQRYVSNTAGNVIFTAKATDEKGAVGTSNALTVTFNAIPVPSNANPVITLSQVSYARLSETVGSAVYTTATATDSDGSISKVVFYANNVAYDTVTVDGSNARTSAPPVSVVSNVYYPQGYISNIAGDVAFTAKATDDKGAVTTSNAITVTFTAPSDEVVIQPAKSK